MLHRLSHDPFGARRESNWSADLTPASLTAVIAANSTLTSRGFIDHEHLDRTGIVHMNGRLYDPRIGRFLQPDPFVDNPANSQSYNRYAYVRNQPLALVDPSGFAELDMLEGITVTGTRYFEPWLHRDMPRGVLLTPPEPDWRQSKAIDAQNYVSDALPDKVLEEVIVGGKALKPRRPSTVGGIDLRTTGEGHVLPKFVKPISDWLVDYIGDVRASWYYGFGFLEANLAGLPPIVGGPLNAARGAVNAAKGTETIFKTTHYASRLEKAGVSVARAESEVAKAVSAMRPNMVESAAVSGRMAIDGTLVEYRVMMLPNGTVSVGTIFPVVP